MAKSNIEKLMELKQLYEQGILTKEEMESEKAKILNNDAEESENVESKVEEDQPVQEETQTISEEETYLYEEESFFEKYKTYIYVGIAVLIAIILFAVFAGSKGNVNNSVATEVDDNILAGIQKESVVTEKVEPIKEDNSIGEWRKKYYKDEFGEILKDEPYIVMSLNAHRASKPHDDEYIHIQYAKNSEIEYFAISNNELYYRVSPGEKDGPSVSIKKNGDVEEIEVVKRRGYAYIFEERERRYFADLVAEGNFILKVGDYIVEIKDETKGFRNALKLLGDVEILNPEGIDSSTSAIINTKNNVEDLLKNCNWIKHSDGFQYPDFFEHYEKFLIDIPASVEVYSYDSIDLCYWPSLGVWSVADEFPSEGLYLSPTETVKNVTYRADSKGIASGYTNSGKIYYLKQKIMHGEGVDHSKFLVLINPPEYNKSVEKLTNIVAKW